MYEYVRTFENRVYTWYTRIATNRGTADAYIHGISA